LISVSEFQKFKVTTWAKDDYGSFYNGDSYYEGAILIVYIASKAGTANVSRAREFIIGISGVRVANR
jgi:hypothetical protein